MTVSTVPIAAEVALDFASKFFTTAENNLLCPPIKEDKNHEDDD